MTTSGDGNVHMAHLQRVKTLLLQHLQLVQEAVLAAGLEAQQSALSQLRSAFQSLLSSGAAAADALAVSRASFWRRLRAEVLEPLALALEGQPGEDELQSAVEAAEALATRNCGHVGCASILGASEADAPRGKRCAACRLVRYCSVACQAADWPGHKAACRELARRKSAGCAPA